MIRIEELDNGVLAIINESATYYTTTLDDLPMELAERYEILRATDVGTVIEGIGRHVSVRTFWIYEDKDANRDNMAFLGLERMFVLKLWRYIRLTSNELQI